MVTAFQTTPKSSSRDDNLDPLLREPVPNSGLQEAGASGDSAGEPARSHSRSYSPPGIV